jgi:hypothetical protein
LASAAIAARCLAIGQPLSGLDVSHSKPTQHDQRIVAIRLDAIGGIERIFDGSKQLPHNGTFGHAERQHVCAGHERRTLWRQQCV